VTSLHLARVEDADRLLAMVAACHREMGFGTAPEAQAEGLVPLLEGSPHGAVYLIGPARSPIGYIVICFGWSVEFGGLDGFVDEIWIRPGVRGRGIGGEVLTALPKALAGAGLKALHLEVRRDDAGAQRLYRRQKFEARENYMLMTRKFRP